ncbi:Leucine rich repeat containing protein BspA family protein [Entamoeba marina]
MDNNTKQLDSYSILIVSKYFESTYDYINIICVCKKFKETTEKLRFNPIPITTLKLFPKIQTQYLYDESDIKISGVGHFEIWFKVDYNQYLENKVKGIKCHHVKYNEEHRKQYGNDIPIGVSILENDCYSYCDIKNITIPNQVTSIGKGCFYDCSKLTHVLLSNGLTSISYSCFYKCVGLTSMTIPPSVQKLGSNCFARCYNLETIEIPDSVTSIDSSTFRNCEWLKSVRLPPSLHTLKSWTFRLWMRCFEGCGIREIEIPKSVESIGIECFFKLFITN